MTTADAAWIPRYAEPGEAETARLADIPHLCRRAWEHALAFPELGGEGIDDLAADLADIIARERDRLTAAARDAAAIKAAAEASPVAVAALRSASRRLAEGMAGIAADGGIDPRGCFVYLLWEHKNDQVPLYVGQSVSLMVRLGSHMSDPEKRHRVRWITLIRCRDARRMAETELLLIRRYRPELNTAGIPAEDVP